MEKTHNYCFDCDKETLFEIVFKEEEVKIKKESFVAIHKYYKCSSCGELFEPLDDIDFNLNVDYSIYRELKGYLLPAEIKNIREKYNLSQRQFAELLGFSHATISNIENGSLQNTQQNMLFLMASSPHGFKRVIDSNKTGLSLEGLDRLIESLIISENKELSERLAKLDKAVRDAWEISNNITARINLLEHDSKMVERDLNKSIIQGAKKSWMSYIPILTLS